MNITREEFPIGVRDLLAKLLASENISIRHSSAYKTAAFDLDSRTLHLPLWKDCSADVLSLMIGHEVGHALYTPNKEWVDKVKAQPKLKSIMNVVEDYRIEKMIKTKFPGLKKNFTVGYKEMFDNGFFGVKDTKGLNFLDRLNIYTKLSAAGLNLPIKFNEQEQALVTKLAKCLTFQDVIKISEEIFAYFKDSVKDNPEPETPATANPSEGFKSEDFGEDIESVDSKDSKDSEDEDETEDSENDSDDSDGEDSEGDSEESSEKDSEDGEDGKESDPDDSKDSEEEESAGKSGKSEDSEESEEKESEENKKISGENKQKPTEQEKLEEMLKSLTQEALNEQTQNLVDTSASQIVYADIIKIEPKKFIVDYKHLHNVLTKHFTQKDGPYSHTTGLNRQQRQEKNKELLTKFQKANEKTVSYMVKEFEMKKSAAQHARALTAKTGVLNTNKIFSYKYNEDLFKKNTILPKGKNHGLIMFIDMSSSMHGTMAGTIDQLMTIVSFCRKVQIPFEVYGFSDQGYYGYTQRKAEAYTPLHYGNAVPGELTINGTFFLKNYFSSRMSTKELSEAMYNMMYLANCYREYSFNYDLPSFEQLGNTPLNEAILVGTKIVADFKKDNNLDIVNTIFLTDGNANGYFSLKDGYRNDPISPYAQKVMVHDKSAKKNIEISRETTDCLIKHLKSTTGVNVIGFFICSRRSSSAGYNARKYDAACSNDDKEAQAVEDLKKNNAYVCKEPIMNFDAYYLIAGEGLEIDETEVDDLEFNEGASKNKIRRAFQDVLENKFKNRVILSKFIEKIA